jgi:hypothetical protein
MSVIKDPVLQRIRIVIRKLGFSLKGFLKAYFAFLEALMLRSASLFGGTRNDCTAVPGLNGESLVTLMQARKFYTFLPANNKRVKHIET